MLSGEELAIDKVLALFGRAEARDFVDLMALEPRYGLERLCEDASSERGGEDRTEPLKTSNVTVRAHSVPPPVPPRRQ